VTPPAPGPELAEAIRAGRHIVAAAVLAVLWAAEGVAPMFPARSRRVGHAINNLALAALNTALAFCAAAVILHATEWSREHRAGLLHWVGGPEWVRWILAMVLLDCWQYWWHRFNHRVHFLWRFHAVHHADADMDVTTGVRFHTIEIALSLLARIAVLSLLGLTVPQLVLYEALSLPVILFHHANINLPGPVDRSLRWLVVTPWMHVVHHSRLQPETDSNYSSFLSVWDRLFGSYRLRDRPKEVSLGLDGWQEAEWRGFAGMLLRPLRRRQGN
jgi:sterol desaturase/sphingolipid hydroxylase (fatty acid hydroxylase superfamily)